MTKQPFKILLIEPPFYRLFKDTYSLTRYPLSLGYLAAAITKETNWDVLAYNSDFYPTSTLVKVSFLAGKGFENYLKNLKDNTTPIWKEVKTAIEEFSPAVIGISAKSQNFTSACIVAKLVKEINPEILVVVGGPHPSMVGREVLDCADIDIAVKGEGETTIVELLNAIENQSGFEKISGIIYRKDKAIKENPDRSFIPDLDSLAFPQKTASKVLKDYALYPKDAFKSIFATRGCPYNCFFCGSRALWSRKVRFRSPENVVEEIQHLQKRGITSVHFDDDTFGMTRDYITRLCKALIENCPKVKFSCELHVKLVDNETIKLMKKAGCTSIQIGVESGSNEILKAMRKNITIEEALEACKCIKRHAIELLVFFIVGFPQETEATLQETVKAMRKTQCDYIFYSIFTPYPGTEAFDFCKDKGLIDKDYNIALYNHQSPKNCFCLNIKPERFRQLVAKIEKMVDRKTASTRIKRIFSAKIFTKIQSLLASNLSRIFTNK